MKSSKPPRGYTLLEPPIHGPLHWEMDTIVGCLEIIRRKLPEEFKQLPESLEYDLLAVENPFGPPYPAIGIHTSTVEDLKKIPDASDLHMMVEKWVERMGLDQLKAQASQLEILTWAELEKVQRYPER